MWVTPAKIAINVLGAQAHFSTTQQLFSNSSDIKNELVFRNIFLFQNNIFSVGGMHGDSCQNGKIPFTGSTEVNYE